MNNIQLIMTIRNKKNNMTTCIKKEENSYYKYSKYLKNNQAATKSYDHFKIIKFKLKVKIIINNVTT